MKIITAVCIAFWMLMGGALFFTPLIYKIWLACSFALMVLALIYLARGVHPLQLVPPFLLLLATVVSTLANLDIMGYAVGFLLIQVGAVAALIVIAAHPELDLNQGLYFACWIALLLSGLPSNILGGPENRNIAAIWPALLVLLLIMRRARWYLFIIPIIALIIYGSRGVLVGLAVGLLVYFKPPRKVFVYGVLVLGIGAALLTAIRPQNAVNRIGYWYDALGASVDHNALFGLGPGGLFARKAILEPGKDPLLLNSYQPHAHNLVVNVWAETGMIGLLLLVYGVMYIYNRRDRIDWSAWQWPVLAVFLAHSMVDYTLFYPGPLLIFMVVLGTIKTRQQIGGLANV
jgi:O-antigen ligase